MKFSIYYESRTGNRHTNQDRLIYRYTAEALLMVVADGMGGHSHGDIAAQLCTVRIAKSFGEAAKPRLADPARFLQDALLDAHKAVRTLAKGHSRPPHTTCIACVIQDGHAWWAHAGDSRLYFLRDDKVLERTRDHSYVEGLLQQGLIKAADLQQHPQRHLVINCLGTDREPWIDHVDGWELRRDDIIMLCTDGFWEQMPEHIMLNALKKIDLLKVSPKLLDMAEANAGDNGDNLTLIAMRWGDNDPRFSNASTAAGFEDTVADPNYAYSQVTLSDDDIERVTHDIQTKLKPK